MEIREQGLVLLGSGNEDGYIANIASAKSRVLKSIQMLALAILCLG